MQLDLIRRVQLPMIAIYVAVEIGDDDGAVDLQGEFDEAFAALIDAPLSGPEDAALRLRCLAQVGEYYDGCTSMAGAIYDALRVIADGLHSAEGRAAA